MTRAEHAVVNDDLVNGLMLVTAEYLRADVEDDTAAKARLVSVHGADTLLLGVTAALVSSIDGDPRRFVEQLAAGVHDVHRPRPQGISAFVRGY